MMQPKRNLAALLPLIGLAAWTVALAQTLINQRLDLGVYFFIGAGLACFVLYGVFQPGSMRVLTAARHGAPIIVLGVALLAALNVAAATVFFRLDLTELRGYSLSPQTLDALKKLQEPVNITAFLSQTDQRSQLASKLLGEYADHSSWITYEIVDPDVKPSVTQQKGVTRYGTLLFEQGIKRQEINSVDEQSITIALLRLAENQPQTLYFSSGHGERDLESPRREGYNVLVWYLQNKGYTVETFNFDSSPTLPENMAGLVVASPRQAFPQRDQDLLDSFLMNGGRLLVLLDAGLPVPFPQLLEKWGVQAGENLVFDPKSSFFGDAATPLVSQFGPSLITRSMGGMNVFFPVAREVAASKTISEGLRVDSLVQTSDQSWAEMNLQDPQASFDPAVDKAGPISLAVTVQSTLAAGRGAKGAKARLVVFGDSDFVSNAALSSTDANLGNAVLLTNALNWLVEDENLISLKPISTEARRVILTGQQMRWVGYGTILFVPLLIAFIGGLVWWQRRG